MTARTRRLRRTRHTARSRALPFPLFLVTVCAAVTIGATALRALGAGPGAPGMDGALAGTAGRVMAFLDYFAGVFTLLSLTAAVVCGLAATDRLVLSARHRVAMQSVHRATSVAALGFLATHIGVKVAELHATPLAALLPFGGGATFAVGLGTLAADLLVLTAATGAVRGRFAGSRRPWLWRLLHSGAYACWPIALAHGLTAGRAAAVWVLWSYGLCAAAVGLALLVRLLGAAGRGSARRRTLRTLRAYAPGRPKTTAVLTDEPVSLAVHGQYPVQPEPSATVATPVAPVPVGVADHAQHATYPYQPQYAEAASGGYGYPAPSPWSGDGRARPHPTLAETPPHGFSVPGDLLATPYAPSPASAAAPDWLEDSGAWAAWSALAWDTPPHGVPVAPAGAVPDGVYLDTGVPYSGAQYAGAQYAGGRYPAGQYAAGQYYGGDQYPSAPYGGRTEAGYPGQAPTTHEHGGGW